MISLPEVLSPCQQLRELGKGDGATDDLEGGQGLPRWEADGDKRPSSQRNVINDLTERQRGKEVLTQVTLEEKWSV